MTSPERLSRAELIRRLRAAEETAREVNKARVQRQELENQQEENRVQNSQLREMQQSLELSRDRYAELYDFAPLAYATLEHGGVIKEINLTGAALLGMERTKLIDRHLMLHVHREDRERLHEHLHQVMHASGDVSAELRMVSRSGREFPAQLTTHRIHSTPDAVQVLRTAIVDLTDLHRTEEERRNALLREQSARTAAETKDRLIAMVSHELRTPLSAMMLWAKILQIKLRDQPEHAKALDIILRSADAQRQLIDDLLDISRISSGKLRLNIKTVALAPLVSAAVESVLPLARTKGIAITGDVEPELGTLKADPDRLQQVFWNLLTNAVKFTPAGGHIQVSARRVGTDADVRFIDSGQGIEPSFLPHMFEPFQQGDNTITTRAAGGLGLGLAISRQLVEHHGGSIHVRSKGLGKGATFVVRLPLSILVSDQRPARAPETAQPSQSDTAALSGLNVLLVEDESATRSALVALISGAGANVSAVDSAAAAIEAFQRLRPDLIIGDIGMAGQDGYQMMRRLRALEGNGSLPRVPALALTAFVSTADSRQALSAGFDTHMGKPVDPASLLAKLRELAKRSIEEAAGSKESNRGAAAGSSGSEARPS
jgi:PAS domain S-box-containing protein